MFLRKTRCCLSGLVSVLALLGAYASAASAAYEPISLQFGQWNQITIPGLRDPSENTYADVFADDLSEDVYGTEWALFTFDPNTGLYTAPELSQDIPTARGHWIIQAIDDVVEIDLPASTEDPIGLLGFGCLEGEVCLQAPIASNWDYEGSGWGMVGNPNDAPSPISSWRLRNVYLEPCARGCDLATALELKAFELPLYRWDPSANESVGGYQNPALSDSLNQWEALWFGVPTRSGGEFALDSTVAIPTPARSDLSAECPCQFAEIWDQGPDTGNYGITFNVGSTPPQSYFHGGYEAIQYPAFSQQDVGSALGPNAVPFLVDAVTAAQPLVSINMITDLSPGYFAEGNCRTEVRYGLDEDNPEVLLLELSSYDSYGSGGMDEIAQSNSHLPFVACHDKLRDYDQTGFSD